MDDSIFRQKGAGVPRGIESTAQDAVPSEQSGQFTSQDVGRPVWLPFVENATVQKESRGTIAADEAYMRQENAGSKERWGGDNGRLLRRTADGKIEAVSYTHLDAADE